MCKTHRVFFYYYECHRHEHYEMTNDFDILVAEFEVNRSKDATIL